MRKFSFKTKHIRTRYSLHFLFIIILVAFTISCLALRQFEKAMKGILTSVGQLTEEALLEQMHRKVEIVVTTLAQDLINPFYYLDIQTINRLFDTVKTQEDVSYVYLYYPDGKIVTDGTDENPLLDKILTDEVSKKAQATDKFLLQTKEETLDVSMPIYIGDEKLGGVRVGFSLNKIKDDISRQKETLTTLSQQSIRNTISTSIIITAILIILGMMFALMAARVLVEPILKLTEVSRRIGKGDLRVRVDIKSGDELEELANSFNRMTEDLQKTTVSIKVLEKEQRRFQDVAVSTGDWIWEVDDQGRYTYSSAVVEKILGYKPEEVIGKYFYDFFHPDDREELKKAAFEVFAKKGVFKDFPNRNIRKDGQVVILETSGLPLVDAEGKLLGYRGADRDVTTRILAEEKIFRLNRLYLVLSNINQAIVRIREQKKLLEEICRIIVEQGLFRMVWIGLLDDTSFLRPVAHYGFEEGYLAAIKAPTEDVAEAYRPPEAAIGEGKSAVCNDIKNDPRMLPWREEALKRGYHSCASFPFKVGTKVAGVLNVYAAEAGIFDENETGLLNELTVDISFALNYLEEERLRKRAEEALRQNENYLNTIFNSAQTGMMIVDAETHLITDVNPVIIKAFGAPREQIVGALCHQYICPAEKGKCPITDLGQKVDNAERVLVKANGERMSVLKTVVPIILNNRQFLLETFVDITDRKRAEEELKKAYDELKVTQAQLIQQEKMASLGQLTTGIAHELNNPLSYILSNVSTLKKYVLAMLRAVELYHQQNLLFKEDSLQKAKLAEQALDRLKEELDFGFIIKDLPNLVAETQEGLQKIKGIIEDLRVFSHTDKVKMSYADINELIESTVKIAWNELKYKADLVKDYAVLPAVLCYPQQLTQVFMNIITNAVQAIEQHGTIIIKTYTKEQSVFIEISDTGCGIPPEHLPHIFEHFFTTKPIGKGVGLGLSIVYSIIQKHKGHIEVRSKVGQGTTFIIKLPVEQGSFLRKNGSNKGSV